MNTQHHQRSVPDIANTWSSLQEQVFLKPIRSDDDYRKMVTLANELADRLAEVRSPLDELLDVVTDLIELWESRNVHMPTAEPREVLRYLLNAHGLRQKDLAEIASPTIISDILAGRRAISKKVAKGLAARFGVSPSTFILTGADGVPKRQFSPLASLPCGVSSSPSKNFCPAITGLLPTFSC